MDQQTVKAILALYAIIAVAGISIAGLTVGQSSLALKLFSALFGVGLLAAAAYDRVTRTPEPISDSPTRPSPWDR
jgi:hypothetical protein